MSNKIEHILMIEMFYWLNMFEVVNTSWLSWEDVYSSMSDSKVIYICKPQYVIISVFVIYIVYTYMSVSMVFYGYFNQNNRQPLYSWNIVEIENIITLTNKAHRPCCCAFHVDVVINFCDAMWFSVEAKLCRF